MTRISLQNPILKVSIVLALTALGGFGCVNVALAQTPPETKPLTRPADTTVLILSLQKQVLELLKQIQTLQTEIGALKSEAGFQTPSPSPISPSSPLSPLSETELPEFTRSLSLGARGDDVRKLQEFLARDRNIYPEGLTTGYYGPKTAEAVRRWQRKNSIEAVGIVGPKTIAKFRELGRGVAQGLIQQGIPSGVIPPGLVMAPGRQMIPSTNRSSTTTTPYITATSTPPIVAAAISPTSTTTPAGTIPAVSAIPATPTSTTALSGISTAITAVSASTATTTATTTSSTATTSVTATVPVFTVIYPNSAEQLTVGNTYTITWTSAGVNVTTVNIDLYKSGGYVTAITDNAPNSGSAAWTIPSTLTALTAGSDYKIRVYNNMYPNNFDESDGAFSIVVPVVAPSSPPIGYWKFDGSGNNEIAGSPSAVTVGSAVFKTSGGKFGGYLYMPGSNDYAKIPYNSIFNLPNAFTVEFWFRQRSNQSFNQNLIYKGTPPNNYNFNIFRYLWNQYNNGSVIAGSTAAGSGYWHQVSNPNEPPHNGWHHVVYTKTTTGAAYYIDGGLIYARSYGATGLDSEYYGPVKTPAVDIIIGNPAPDTDIDNVRIYNYSLSRGEVLYNWENVPGVTTASDTTAPSTPTNLTAAVISQSQIRLSWTASTDNTRVSGYKVYRDGVYVKSVTLALDVAPNSAVDTFYYDYPLNPATTYTYNVAAYDAAGNVSAQSLSVTAATLDATAPTVSLAVGYPNLTTQTQPVYVGFNASEEVNVVYEYGLTTSYGSIQTVGDQYWTGNGAYLPTLSSGTTYHIRAKATDRAGNVGYSQDYTFTTASTNSPPEITSGPNHTPTDATPKEAVSIGFGTSLACDSSFQYGLSTAYGTSKTPIDPTNKTSHHFFLTGLAANTTYYYKVTCVGAYGTVEKTGSYTTGNTTNTTTSPSTATTTAAAIDSLSELLKKLQQLLMSLR